MNVAYELMKCSLDPFDADYGPNYFGHSIFQILSEICVNILRMMIWKFTVDSIRIQKISHTYGEFILCGEACAMNETLVWTIKSHGACLWVATQHTRLPSHCPKWKMCEWRDKVSPPTTVLLRMNCNFFCFIRFFFSKTT